MFLVDVLIVCEMVALIILVLLIRYLFGCCCLARRFAFPLCGFACVLNPETFGYSETGLNMR